MHELGIDMVFAKTPQAKGRIERLWVTLQSRLPIEFAKRKITTVTEANLFLEQEYRNLFNEKFAVDPEDESIFVPLKKDLNIDSYLCIKHKRKTGQNMSFGVRRKNAKKGALP